MLRFQTVPSSSNAQKRVVLIHGIMGSSRNLISFAKLLTRKFPQWQVILPDLRHHGDSGYFEGPNEISACAQDVFELIQSLNTQIDI